jgi:hypothetical protein
VLKKDESVFYVLERNDTIYGYLETSKALRNEKFYRDSDEWRQSFTIKNESFPEVTGKDSVKSKKFPFLPLGKGARRPQTAMERTFDKETLEQEDIGQVREEKTKEKPIPKALFFAFGTGDESHPYQSAGGAVQSLESLKNALREDGQEYFQPQPCTTYQ